MLNTKRAAQLPERLSFSRAGHVLEAHRVPFGEIEITGSVLKIADAAWADDEAPLPIRVPDGKYAVHVYRWAHPQGPLNVCAVVAFGPQRFALARPLTITNSARPDLTAGIIVDSAEVQIGSASHITLPSGLGDGYYPVAGVYNFGLFLQAVVLDFRLWHVEKVFLRPGQVRDEFGIVRELSQGD